MNNFSDLDIIESCRCFIRRINSDSRKGKRVNLVNTKSETYNLVNKDWVNAALSTTALRKRPKAVALSVRQLLPNQLGYKSVEDEAHNVAECLHATLKRDRDILDQNSFDLIWCNAARKIRYEACRKSLFWRFGRSQKFLNILLKYWYVIFKAYPEQLTTEDNELVCRLEHLMHVPVDSITLNYIHEPKNQCDFSNGHLWKPKRYFSKNFILL